MARSVPPGRSFFFFGLFDLAADAVVKINKTDNKMILRSMSLNILTPPKNLKRIFLTLNHLVVVVGHAFVIERFGSRASPIKVGCERQGSDKENLYKREWERFFELNLISLVRSETSKQGPAELEAVGRAN